LLSEATLRVRNCCGFAADIELIGFIKVRPRHNGAAFPRG
jgi:hypothetical protein